MVYRVQTVLIVLLLMLFVCVKDHEQRLKVIEERLEIQKEEVKGIK